MCYHISFQVNLESVSDYFPDISISDSYNLDYPTASYLNGFDHPSLPIVLKSRKDDSLTLAPMMWGFIPNWIKSQEEAEKFWNGYKDQSGKYVPGFTTLNAKGEELLNKPMWKDAALNRRCVFISDGMYEWRHIHGINKRTGEPLKTATKYPYHISTNDGAPFTMMAGIWNPWRFEEVDKETGELKKSVVATFAIVTTAANELMSQVHNSKERMPSILTKDLAMEWINKDLSEQRITEIATQQYPASKMKAYTIAKDFQKVNNPKEQYEYEDLSPIVC